MRARSGGIIITGRSREYCGICGIKEADECETCDFHSDGGVTFQWGDKTELLQTWLLIPYLRNEFANIWGDFVQNLTR